MSTTATSSFSVIASAGHSSMQSPHAVQSSAITFAGILILPHQPKDKEDNK
jgi:hypothetical protein